MGQFIHRAFPAEFAVDVGDDQGIHKALDEGRFSRPDGADHANVDIALGSLGNIMINIAFFHIITISPCANQIIGKEARRPFHTEKGGGAILGDTGKEPRYFMLGINSIMRLSIRSAGKSFSSDTASTDVLYRRAISHTVSPGSA